MRMRVLNMLVYAYRCLLKSYRFILSFPVLELLNSCCSPCPFPPPLFLWRKGEARGLFARRKARDSRLARGPRNLSCGRLSRTKSAGMSVRTRRVLARRRALAGTCLRPRSFSRLLRFGYLPFPFMAAPEARIFGFGFSALGFVVVNG